MENVKKPIAIYIATHSEQPKVVLDYEIPIQAGAALSEKKICKIGDNKGENISDKNPQYCELTVWYWIWKNDSHSIVGLSHYRRRFEIDYKKAIQLLDTYDMIIPHPYFFRYSLKEEYGISHSWKDLKILLDILHEFYPELDGDVHNVFNDNRLIPYNMFIAKKEHVNDYFEWLFPVLFEAEKRLDLSGYPIYQRRIYGFFAERLFTLYVVSKQLNVYSCPVQIPEKSTSGGRFKLWIGQCFNQLYYSIRKKL